MIEDQSFFTGFGVIAFLWPSGNFCSQSVSK